MTAEFITAVAGIAFLAYILYTVRGAFKAIEIQSRISTKRAMVEDHLYEEYLESKGIDIQELSIKYGSKKGFDKYLEEKLDREEEE